MGIFDFFKKKKTTSDRPPVQETPKTMVPTEITSIDHGSHGDNFGGLIGFELVNTDEGGQFILEQITLGVSKKPVYSSGPARLYQATFRDGSGNTARLGVRALTLDGNVLSAFPYLQTTYVVPVQIGKVMEWSHSEALEAEISVQGRETFGFGFFATDYLVNIAKYRTQQQLDIKVSAICLVLDKNETTEVGGMKLSDDFAAYMPSSDIPRPTYFDFMGVLVDFEPVRLAHDQSGFILRVKLINESSDPDFFTVDMFVNRANMRIHDLKKGMRVAGALWFQGEIA